MNLLVGNMHGAGMHVPGTCSWASEVNAVPPISKDASSFCANATAENTVRLQISRRNLVRSIVPHTRIYTSAITSISTATSLGSLAASTVERAGGAFLQVFP